MDRRTVGETGRFLGFLAMALGMFMALIDIQIVSGSLRDIQGGLSASRDEMSWVQTSYLVAEIVMIPLTGWLASVFSTRWLFTASAVLFTVASLLCGLAWSIESMIVFRVVQGFVGGAMIPLAFSAGFALFRGPKAALIPAVLGVMGTLAPTLGPTLGGWITETLSWRHLFYVNIVPGLVIAVAVPVFVRVDEPDLSRLRGFDALSIPFIAIAFGGLGYVLEEGVRKDWFASPIIAAAAAAALASFVVVVWRGLIHRRPVLDFGALAIPNYGLGCALAFIVGVGNYGAIYVLPVFLGEVRAFNSLDIGRAIFVTGVAQVLTTIVIAARANRVDQRLLLAVGLVGYGASLAMMTRLTHDWGGAEFFWALVLRGAASMAVVVPITSFALAGVPRPRLPSASGLFNLMRNLGGAVGIAVISAMLQQGQTVHYTRMAERVTPFVAHAAEVRDGLATRFGAVFADDRRADRAGLSRLAKIAEREAFVLAISDVLKWMAALFFIGLAAVPFLRRKEQVAAAVEGKAHEPA